jgi:site-specific DNA-methyltransferase (adenine-specific)
MKIPIAEIYFTPTEFKEEQVIAGQQRQSMTEQLDRMAESMKEQGQLQPISVRAANDLAHAVAPTTMLQYVLNFGEKRVRAAQKLGWTEIEAVVEEMTERQAQIKRCHENLRRFNLPWYEQATETERLHSLRQEEHGPAKTGRPAKDEEKKGWSVRDTAEELGAALGTIAEDINLARAVRLDPALRNIQDRKTAIKVIKNTVKREQARLDADAPKNIEVNEVYLGDSATILASLPDCSVDMVWTDPPWLSFFDQSLTRDARTFPVFKEVFRVMKFNTLCYIVIGFEDLPHYAGFERMNDDGTTTHVPGELERIGFAVSKTPVIWRKINALSRRGVKSWEYDRDFEIVVVAAKGSPALTSSTRLSGVKQFAVVPSRSLVHPHEKPVDLVKDFLKDGSYEGNIILDPFAGSGVTASACKALKRNYILIERDKERYDKILKRLGKG